MTMDRLTRAVREQIALGRLLPLGGPGDPLWIAESAAVRVLRRACAPLPGVRLGPVEVALAAGTHPAEAHPAAPMGALPHAPVRIGAAFDAAADEPLPVTADRLRAVLWEAAEDLLGLAVAAVDLRVTGLLDGEPPAGEPAADGAEPSPPAEVAAGPSAALAATALTVPGVARVTARLAGFGPGVLIRDTAAPDPAPGRHVQLQLALTPPRPPVMVAHQVLTAVSSAAAPGAPGPVTTAVVVTDA